MNLVTEGNLLNQDGANTLFNSGNINNSAGTVTNVYGTILGNTSVSLQGIFASISMTAGSTTGYLDLVQFHNPVIQTNVSNTDATINPCKSVKSVSFYFLDTD